MSKNIGAGNGFELAATGDGRSFGCLVTEARTPALRAGQRKRKRRGNRAGIGSGGRLDVSVLVENREPADSFGFFADFSFAAAADEGFVKAVRGFGIAVFKPIARGTKNLSGWIGVVRHERRGFPSEISSLVAVMEAQIGLWGVLNETAFFIGRSHGELELVGWKWLRFCGGSAGVPLEAGSGDLDGRIVAVKDFPVGLEFGAEQFKAELPDDLSSLPESGSALAGRSIWTAASGGVREELAEFLLPGSGEIRS